MRYSGFLGLLGPLVAVCPNVLLGLAVPCSQSQSTSATTWTVENSDDAAMLAGMVNCSGGVFDVDWRGEVEITETLNVFDGTILNITGTDSAAAADGMAQTQFIRVTDAELHISGLQIKNCSGEDLGGAIFTNNSVVTLKETSFMYNSASSGGALYLSEGSSVSLGGDTSFLDNNAVSSGGALFVSAYSSVFWNGKSIFANNKAGVFGGAVRVEKSSSVGWNAQTSFTSNSASSGGALHVFGDSEVFWSGLTYFADHMLEGSTGGALYVGYGSSVSWSAVSSFTNNSGILGGAIYVVSQSSVSWSGPTTFKGNTASVSGGALFLHVSSVVSWSAETTFGGNSASSGGGAVGVNGDSHIYWNSTTNFTGNSVTSPTSAYGGAIAIEINSSLVWSGQSYFVANIAAYGGALHVNSVSNLRWTGSTTFTGNYAYFNGGAIGSRGAEADQSASVGVANGATLFLNNACGANGGAVALMGGLEMTFEATKVEFRDNVAEIAGGAVFMSGTAVGPVFVNVQFISNSAQAGGGVYATGSGTQVKSTLGLVEYPTSFSNCYFTGNSAEATGGAIESAAGKDVFVNTIFSKNVARAGGALRLAGISSLTNCTFVDNVSDEGEGPAVSNIGLVTDIFGCSFEENVFNCGTQTFRDVTESERYQTVCNGCLARENCTECRVMNESYAPICTAAMEHTNSSGGSTTVETLEIDPGYWRATSTSRTVLACYNADACGGNMTASLDYCNEGYEGPYCSVCGDGYSSMLAFTCSECLGSRVDLAFVVSIGVFALVVAAVFVQHMVAGKQEGTGDGIITRVVKLLPLQSLKIVIVVWQIVTQFASVANITYPDVYQRFLDVVNVLNFDLGVIPSFGCVFDFDFHSRLLMSTLGPIAVMGLLALTFIVARHRNRGSEAAVRAVRHKHVSVLLLVTFLVYSSVSATVFQMFACEHLDDGEEYLRADYRIHCDSDKHRALQGYAAIMIFVYPVGIPLLYAVLLYRTRDTLKDKIVREDSLQVQSISGLWRPYTHKRFYYEVVECARRILLTGVVVFIYPNTAAQVAITLIIAFAFVLLSEHWRPYLSKWDAGIALAGHVIIFLSMYVALLLKVDVSDERDESQEVVAGVLVAAHVCMIVAVVVEAIVLGCSAREQ